MNKTQKIKRWKDLASKAFVFSLKTILDSYHTRVPRSEDSSKPVKIFLMFLQLMVTIQNLSCLHHNLSFLFTHTSACFLSIHQRISQITSLPTFQYALLKLLLGKIIIIIIVILRQLKMKINLTCNWIIVLWIKSIDKS